MKREINGGDFTLKANLVKTEEGKEEESFVEKEVKIEVEEVKDEMKEEAGEAN